MSQDDWDERALDDGRRIRWRRRKARSDESSYGTDFVIEVEFDGGPVETYQDVDNKADRNQQLELFLRQFRYRRRRAT
jgi:hypothetical protein